MRYRRALLAPILLLTIFAAVGCALLSASRHDNVSRSDRLQRFPRNAPLAAAAQIYWNDYDVPFIEAQNDDDLPFLLGMVQAHLRLGQMEFLKRVAQGRISESAGPLTVEIDHALRIIGFRRGAERAAQALDPVSRRWLERYVAGVNFYAAQMKAPPPEFSALNIRFEPWSVEDALTVGRLAATDVNWLQWFQLLSLREEVGYDEFRRRIYAYGAASTPSFTASAPANGEERSALARRSLAALLLGLSRSGSNAFALSPSRTEEGAAILAGDPHLGLFVPNFWILVGLKSPGYHALGFTVPGVPVIAVGRNNHFAWGGTNMRARSSDLFDVTALPESELRMRRETIVVRAWPDTEVEIRESAAGPLISDAAVVNAPRGRRIALRWLGHDPSDEIGAFLAVIRARDFDEFRAAFADYAVSSQNFLYADQKGNIGQILAYRQPLYDNAEEADFIRDWAKAEQRWNGFRSPQQQPYSLNPSDGYLASANNLPTNSEPAVNPFFGDNDRIDRLKDRLRTGRYSLQRVRELQLDVYSARGVELRDRLIGALAQNPASDGLWQKHEAMLQSLRAWDGQYRSDSAGALALQLIAAAQAERFYTRRAGEKVAAAIMGGELSFRFLIDDSGSSEFIAELPAAIEQAAPRFARYQSWGQFHRLRLQHPLGNIPLVGSPYRFYEGPAAGSSTTLHKTAHPLQLDEHIATYGAQSRHIHVLDDLDANYFVLLGGQDGWLGSEGFLDQWPLWQAGEYMHVPLRLETVRQRFQRTILIDAQPVE